MPQPLAVEQAQQKLARAYAEAWQHIVREQEKILGDPAAFRRRARLVELRQQVERLMDHLDVETRSWLQDQFPGVYALGAQDGAATAGETITSWTLTHTQALQQLVNDTFSDLLQATKFVRRDAKRFVRDMSKALSELKLTTGKTAVQTGRELRAVLQEHGMRGITYKDGSVHGLDEYSQMVIRTKTGVAYNTGTVNGATDAGVRFFEVMDGPDCGWTFHEDPSLALGMIVDAHEALSEPLSHPNCRRTFGGRPDITSKKGARTAPRSVTDEQTKDQRAFDIANRAKRAVRVPRQKVSA